MTDIVIIPNELVYILCLHLFFQVVSLTVLPRFPQILNKIIEHFMLITLFFVSQLFTHVDLLETSVIVVICGLSSVMLATRGFKRFPSRSVQELLRSI